MSSDKTIIAIGNSNSMDENSSFMGISIPSDVTLHGDHGELNEDDKHLPVEELYDLHSTVFHKKNKAFQQTGITNKGYRWMYEPYSDTIFYADQAKLKKLMDGGNRYGAAMFAITLAAIMGLTSLIFPFGSTPHLFLSFFLSLSILYTLLLVPKFREIPYRRIMSHYYKWQSSQNNYLLLKNIRLNSIQSSGESVKDRYKRNNIYAEYLNLLLEKGVKKDYDDVLNSIQNYSVEEIRERMDKLNDVKRASSKDALLESNSSLLVLPISEGLLSGGELQDLISLDERLTILQRLEKMPLDGKSSDTYCNLVDILIDCSELISQAHAYSDPQAKSNDRERFTMIVDEVLPCLQGLVDEVDGERLAKLENAALRIREITAGGGFSRNENSDETMRFTMKEGEHHA